MSDEPPTLDPTPNPDFDPRENEGAGSEGSTPFIPPAGSPARMPKQIGKYRIKKLIGQGGMGAVYQAVQEKPRRNVAIKLMKSGVTSSSALRRFEYESQLLARLRHPGIAEVYDAGTHEAHDGSVPYFVMEYIPGAKRITDYVRDKKLGTRERLNLFLEVASAVHHGHTKGIIHRDLKPDNIIVDSHGRVKVIDFGVARATDSDMAVTTMQTDIGQLIGTVQYMSPEQVEAEPDDLDTRSDVYSLGVVLYEILCGKLPYDVSKLKIYDATRAVRESEAHKLSTIDTALRGDVETIVAKAMEKDRERRYQTAQAFEADIEHYLKDEPITARPASLVYQTRVFARRNKAVVIGVAAVFGALLLGLAGMSYLYLDTNQARLDAETARTSEAAQRQLADREKAAALEAQAAALKANELITQNLYYADMTAAGHAAAKPDGLNTVANLTDKWTPQPATPATAELRGWEWYYLRSQLHQDVRTIPAPPNQRPFYAWTASGLHIAMFTEENTLEILDTYTGQIKHTLPADSQKRLLVKWSPDAQRITTVDLDGSLKIWNAATGRQTLAIPGAPDEWTYTQWSSSGKSLAAINRVKNTLTLLDATTGEVMIDLPLEPKQFVRQLVWSPDDTKIAAMYDNSEIIQIWNTQTGQDMSPDNPQLSGRGLIFSIAWSPDGKHIATGHLFNTPILIWDVQTSQITQTLSGHSVPVFSLAWSADGKRLASGAADNTVKLWDVETAEALALFRGHKRMVNKVSWSPDETQLISSSSIALKIWNTTPAPHMGHDDLVYRITWSPDGQRIASGSNDGEIKIWDADTRLSVATLIGHTDRVWRVMWNPDSQGLITSSLDDTIKLWDTTTGKVVRDLPTHVENKRLVLWADRYILHLKSDGTIDLLDPTTGALVHQLTGHTDQVRRVAFSPNGAYIASGGEDNQSILWDAASGDRLRELKGHTNGVYDLAWSPDSTHLVSASTDGTLKLWDVKTDAEPLTLKGHSNGVVAVAFSPDGKRFASGSRDSTIKIWDAATGKETLTLIGHNGPVLAVAFSPDGQRIASSSNDGVIKIWDASKGFAAEPTRAAQEIPQPSTP